MYYTIGHIQHHNSQSAFQASTKHARSFGSGTHEETHDDEHQTPGLYKLNYNLSGGKIPMSDDEKVQMFDFMADPVDGKVCVSWSDDDGNILDLHTVKDKSGKLHRGAQTFAVFLFCLFVLFVCIVFVN